MLQIAASLKGWREATPFVIQDIENIEEFGQNLANLYQSEVMIAKLSLYEPIEKVLELNKQKEFLGNGKYFFPDREHIFFK